MKNSLHYMNIEPTEKQIPVRKKRKAKRCLT